MERVRRYIKLTGVLGCYVQVGLFACGVGLPLGLLLASRTHASGRIMGLTQACIYTLIVVGGSLYYCADSAYKRVEIEAVEPTGLIAARFQAQPWRRLAGIALYELYQFTVLVALIILVRVVASSVNDSWDR